MATWRPPFMWPAYVGRLPCGPRMSARADRPSLRRPAPAPRFGERARRQRRRGGLQRFGELSRTLQLHHARLVHVKGAVDLDLHGVTASGGRAVVLGDVAAGVGLVAADAIAARAAAPIRAPRPPKARRWRRTGRRARCPATPPRQASTASNGSRPGSPRRIAPARARSVPPAAGDRDDAGRRRAPARRRPACGPR